MQAFLGGPTERGKRKGNNPLKRNYAGYKGY
jgi:hypothetical protein